MNILNKLKENISDLEKKCLYEKNMYKSNLTINKCVSSSELLSDKIKQENILFINKNYYRIKEINKNLNTCNCKNLFIIDTDIIDLCNVEYIGPLTCMYLYEIMHGDKYGYTVNNLLYPQYANNFII